MEKSTDNARPARAVPRFFLVAVAALAALILALSLAIAVRSVSARKKLEHSFGTLTQAYPTIAFERIRFSKYLARGTRPGNDPHFSRLDVFLARGSADIQFDLSRFEVDERRTNYLARTLVLTYTGKERFLVDADIHIEPEGITLAESIDPAPFTKDERAEIKAMLAVPAGAVGGLAGAAAGSAIARSSAGSGILKYSGGFGSLFGDTAASLAGGAAGAALGTAAGTGAVYLFTDSFLSAIQPRADANLSVMEMIATAKPLIGMELVCGEAGLSGAGDGADWSDAVERHYRAEFTARINALAKNFGWKKVIVDFGGAK
jgi:hypothetical protein